MADITLVCWSCNKKVNLVVKQYPFFAFELAFMASDIGWVGIVDQKYKRSVIFCSDACYEDQRTKKGALRKFPKKVAR